MKGFLFYQRLNIMKRKVSEHYIPDELWAKIQVHKINHDSFSED